MTTVRCGLTARHWSICSSSSFSLGVFTLAPPVEWRRSSFATASRNSSSPSALFSVWTVPPVRPSSSLRWADQTWIFWESFRERTALTLTVLLPPLPSISCNSLSTPCYSSCEWVPFTIYRHPWPSAQSRPLSGRAPGPGPPSRPRSGCLQCSGVEPRQPVDAAAVSK